MLTPYVGSRGRSTATFRSLVDDALADPTTVTVTVTAPNGTTSTPTPTKDATGVYHVDVTPNAAGIWHVRWVGTGAVAAVDEVRFKALA